MSDETVEVNFGADASEFNAGVALMKAQLATLNAEIRTFARTMNEAGTQGITVAFNQLVAMQREADSLTASLKGLDAVASAAGKNIGDVGGSLERTGAAAGHGASSLAFFTREGRALLDEAASGRWRNFDGTLVLIAGRSAEMVASFVAANPALSALGVAIAAAAGTLGYFAYQGYEAAKAVRGIEFAAARNEFDLTRDAANALVEAVRKFGNVGSTDARAFIEPFLALGPAGEAISVVASQYLPLFTANGETAKQAGDQLAKSFENIAKGGGQAIANSRELSEAERAQAQAMLASGDNVGLYKLQLEILARQFSSVQEEQARTKAATDELDAQMKIASQGGENFTGQVQLLGQAMAESQARIAANEQELGVWMLRAQMATDAAAQLTAALGSAAKADRLGSQISELEGQTKQWQDALDHTTDPRQIETLNRALEITNDKVKKLRDEASGGLAGGDTLSRIAQQNRLIDEQNQGPRSGQLKKELPSLDAAASNYNLPEAERVKAEQDASVMRLKIRDAEFEEEKHKDDQRVTEAGKNSAEIIKLREKEVADAVRVYGEGNAKTQQAEEALARAKEQAANRGAAAGAKAAKDELGAAQESIDGQLKLLEESTKEKLKQYNDDLSHHRVTAEAYVTETKQALDEEIQAVKNAYDQRLAMAGLSQTQRAKLEDQEAEKVKAIQDQIVDAERKAADESQKAWESATKSINSAVDGQISGLLKGTTNLRTALKNIAASLIETGIKGGVNSLLTGLEGSVGKALGAPGAGAGGGQGGGILQAAMSALATALGLNTAATTTHSVATTTGTTAQLTGNAVSGVNTTGILANTVSTDSNTLATQFSGIGKLFGFATGTPYVQQTGVALIHKGERIVPANMNSPEGMQDMLAGGGGGGSSGGDVTHNHNWNLNLPNVKSGSDFGDWLKSNPRALMDSMNRAVGGGHHLGFGNLKS